VLIHFIEHCVTHDTVTNRHKYSKFNSVRNRKSFQKEKWHFIICKTTDKAAQNYVHIREFERKFYGINHKGIHKSSAQEICILSCESEEKLGDT
jgi:hypothetical protein